MYIAIAPYSFSITAFRVVYVCIVGGKTAVALGEMELC